MVRHCVDGGLMESSLVRGIVRAIRRHHPHAYVRKFADQFTRGLPDLIAIVPRPDGPGRVVFLEVKSPRGKTTAIQQAEHAAIRQAGCEVAVVRSAEEALEAVQCKSA